MNLSENGQLVRVFFAVLLSVGAAAWAESDNERAAREEVEKELKTMVGSPPTKIRS